MRSISFCFACCALILLSHKPVTGDALAASSKPCVTKAGEATGITRAFAEYEALLIIRQVTGNWPIESDEIRAPSYRCTQGTVLWTCTARAQVCPRR
jgi:hypothetical protein